MCENTLPVHEFVKRLANEDLNIRNAAVDSFMKMRPLPLEVIVELKAVAEAQGPAVNSGAKVALIKIVNRSVWALKSCHFFHQWSSYHSKIF